MEEAAMIEENHLFSPSSSQSNRDGSSAALSSTQLRLSRLYKDANEGRARKRQSQIRSTTDPASSGDDLSFVHNDDRVARSTSRVTGVSSSRARAVLRRWRKLMCGRHCPSLTSAKCIRACVWSTVLALVALVFSAVLWLSLPYHRTQSVQVTLPIDLSASSASSAAQLWGSAALATPPDGVLPVHVIASCANRLSSLRSCLPSWLSVPEVSSVTVVDWGSEEPLHEKLRDHIERLDGKLRVVTLDEPLPWMLSTSVNLALHFLPPHMPSTLLKLDCDTVLQPEFVQQHPLTQNDFYAGDWRAARDENEVHLNGVLFIHTRSFLRVNGYDERLQSYGYDDTNLHERLFAANLTAHPLQYKFVQHLRHDDSLRRERRSPRRTDDGPQQQRKLQQQQSSTSGSQLSVANFNSVPGLSLDQLIDIAPPFFATQLHRALLEASPRWNTSMSGATFLISPAEQPHTFRASLQQLPVRLENSVSREVWLRAVREAAEITLRRVGLLIDRLPKAADAHEHVHYLMRLMCFWTTDSEQRPLVVHVQHGLSNRLRALASAASVAAAVGMPLKVIWLTDHHCAARFSDLFRVRGELSEAVSLDFTDTGLISVAQLRSQDVWESSTDPPAIDLLSADRFDLYNYMEPEDGAVKDQPIEVKDGRERRSVYVKSAYRLSHREGMLDRNLNRALSSLVLSEPVVELLSPLLQSVGGGGAIVPIAAGSLQAPQLETAIGVHIRHQPPKTEVAGLRTNEYPAAAWAALETARQLSAAEVYVNAMQTAASHSQQRFYVSSDDAAVIAQVEGAMGSDRIMHLTSTSCLDRTTKCTQQALADQLLLGQTSRLLGSVWSSYSEVAALWRLRPISYPAEVSDVVEQTFAAATAVEKSRAAVGPRPVLLTSDLLTLPFTEPLIASFALPPEARSTECRVELVSLLGERCSGTSYLQQLLESNFNVSNTDEYHYRHFFGFEQSDHPFKQAECVLFVGVIRAPMEWLDCFYKYQWQLDQWRYTDWQSFLTQPIVSYTESEMNYTLSQLPVSERPAARQAMLQKSIWHDRNFADVQLSEWQDVFELRRVKSAFMLDTFPHMAHNYVLVRLEDLQAHKDRFLHILRLWFNLQLSSGNTPPAERADVTVESPMPAYLDAQMDYDISHDQAQLHGVEHVHMPAEVREYIRQRLDLDLEARLGYGDTADEQRIAK